jgi:hypothetical protein
MNGRENDLPLPRWCAGLDPAIVDDTTGACRSIGSASIPRRPLAACAGKWSR